MISWYTKELLEIRASPNVNILIHVTGTPSNSTTSSTTVLPSPKAASSPMLDSEKNQDVTTTTTDLEKSSRSVSSSSSADLSVFATVAGRPCVKDLIESFVSGGEKGSAQAGKKNIVAACGPNTLLDEARMTVAAVVGRGEGAEVGLHCESFGW